MRKFLIALAMTTALCAPAMAQQWNPQNYATAIAVMVGYDTKCGGLPPRSHAFMMEMSALVDPKEAAPAVLNVMAAMDSDGLSNWCARIKPLVAQTETTLR